MKPHDLHILYSFAASRLVRNSHQHRMLFFAVSPQSGYSAAGGSFRNKVRNSRARGEHNLPSSWQSSLNVGSAGLSQVKRATIMNLVPDIFGVILLRKVSAGHSDPHLVTHTPPVFWLLITPPHV
jgi:hypothetical protein